VPQLGAPLGFIAANGFFLVLGLLLSPEQMLDWGWRMPFLASAVLVALGLWVRLKLTETPAFAAAMAGRAPEPVPLATVVRSHFPALAAGTLGVVACFAVYYIATAFTLGYGTTTLGYSRTEFLLVQLGAILFMAIGIGLAGLLSDRFDPRRVLIAGCVGTIATGALLPSMLGSGSLLIVFLFLSLALLAMGFVYGPLGAWLPGLFPARVRYTGASMAFNVGGILGGGVAPLAAQAMAERGGLTPVGLYLSFCAAISLWPSCSRGDRARNWPTEPGYPRAASSSAATSILVMPIIACMTRVAAARSGLASNAGSAAGTTCQDRPQRSVSHAHWLGTPPSAMNASHKRSTSA
jgi:MFS family permease